VGEIALDRLLELDQGQVADLQRDGTRLDLGEIEDVIE